MDREYRQSGSDREWIVSVAKMGKSVIGGGGERGCVIAKGAILL